MSIADGTREPPQVRKQRSLVWATIKVLVREWGVVLLVVAAVVGAIGATVLTGNGIALFPAACGFMGGALGNALRLSFIQAREEIGE